MTRCSSFALFFGLVCAAALATVVAPGTVHAGPVEKFMDSSSDASTLALQYQYGSGGFFLSNDKGAHFKMLCSNAVDPGVRDSATLHVSEEGIYLGVFDGVWLGDKNGCGWKRVPELDGQWTGAMAGDPLDTKITYFATSAGAKPNGLYIDSGDTKWTEFGTKSDVFINSLDVIKVGSKKRYYTTAVRSIPSTDPMNMAETPHYMVRYSDDDAKTWTENEFGSADQFGPKDPQADMRIMAIDPTNPDRLVARVARSEDIDDLLYSPMQGKPGTWVKIGQGKDLRGVAFTGDGKLYYGDNDQETPGLFRVDKLGDMPKQLDNSWKVSCLRWDADGQRMLACRDWQFGTANLDTGAFSALLDMRTAESFVECPGEAPVSARCQTQLLAAYCGQAHYEYAAVCSVYDPLRPWLEPLGGSGGSGGSGGASGATAGTLAMSSAGTTAATSGAGGSTSSAGMAGSTNSAGTGTAGKAAVGAGASGQSNAGAAGTSSSSSGCSCTVPGGVDPNANRDLAGLGAVGLASFCGWRRRRR